MPKFARPPRSLRRLIYLALSPSSPDNEAEHRQILWLSRVCEAFLITLIVANVAAVVLESVPDYERQFGHWFQRFELISVLIFTAEYVLRVWSVVEGSTGAEPKASALRVRLAYARTPLALADLLAILPFYLSFLSGVDLRVLRVLRLLRVLKLTRYSSSIGLLLDALRAEAHAIMAGLFVLSLLLVIAASFAYLAEHAAQPDAFGTIPQALWWAVITMTTVGYGDVVPITPLGKVIGGLIGVVGIGMVALPAGLLASGFSEQLHERELRFEAEVERLIHDGRLSPQGRAALEHHRRHFGLRLNDAEAIIDAVQGRTSARPPSCPHCGAALPAGPQRPKRRQHRRLRHKAGV